MQRDIVLWTTSNLAGPWSAGDIPGSLTSEVLQDMTAAFERMEPLVRVRLLLACAFLKPARRAELASELRALAQKASGDDHEWVRLYGTALGEADGRIRLEHSKDAFPVVNATMCELEDKLRSLDGASSTLRPLEEQYLSERLLRMRGVASADPSEHEHFVLARDAAAKGGAGDKQLAAAPMTTAASLASRYSHEHAVASAAGAQARRKGDDEGLMFVKSSHKFKAPALLPATAGAAGQKVKVLDEKDLQSITKTGSLKRRIGHSGATDAEGGVGKRREAGGADKRQGASALGQTAAADAATAANVPGETYVVAPVVTADGDADNEPAPNMF